MKNNPKTHILHIFTRHPQKNFCRPAAGDLTKPNRNNLFD